MDISSSVRVANIILIFCVFYLAVFVYNINIVKLFSKVFSNIIKFIGKRNARKEILYNRSVEIGKIKTKSRRNKVYRFLNDLIIDLGLKKQGLTPTSFVWALSMFSLMLSIMISSIFLSSTYIAIPLTPLVYAILLCILYTKANIVHDLRITGIIDSENLICNNIKDGVLSSVKQSLDLFPEILRNDYITFVENVELKNYHIKDALLELSNNLGSVSEEFIKKCILFDLEEEHGIAESFQDVIEVNNTKTELRIEMKRKFEELSRQFTICSLMVGVVFLGSLVIYDIIKTFYLTTVFGNVILCLDVVLILSVFGYMTYLRARDLA